MSDQRVGAVMRAVRLRRGWRQADVAARAGVSALAGFPDRARPRRDSDVSTRLRSVAAVLDIRLDVVPRWRGGELDRLLNSRHAALTEAVARWLTERRAGRCFPEVSFAIARRAGLIDLLGLARCDSHPAGRRGQDRDRRRPGADRSLWIARRAWPRVIARDRGWIPAGVVDIARDGRQRHKSAASVRALGVVALRLPGRRPNPASVAAKAGWTDRRLTFYLRLQRA